MRRKPILLARLYERALDFARMRAFHVAVLCAVVSLFPGGRLVAQELPPKLTAHVTDYASLLGTRQADITQKLLAFESVTGHQVFLLTVPSTGAQSIEEYAVQVFQKSTIGQRNLDNGVLFVIARDDRKMRIEVGYGLEGVLTDAICTRILNDIVAPQMKDGYYATGIEDGVDAILYDIDAVAAKGPPVKTKLQRRNKRPFAWPDAIAMGGIFAVFWCVTLWLGVLPFACVVTLFAASTRGALPGTFVGAFGWWALTAVVVPWLYLRWRIIAKVVRKHRLQDSTCTWCTWLWAFAFACFLYSRKRSSLTGNLSSDSSSSTDSSGGGSFSDSGGGGGGSGGGGASASW
jgi:uncharacterized protein